MNDVAAAKRVVTRELALHALYEAAELEHNLMCTYLYAAFSLRDGVAEGLAPDEAEVVSRWRQKLIRVAVEEMQHLAAVWNITSALGGGAGLVLLVSLVETSHAIAYGDELTGLPSRRALTESLLRLEGDYTIAMVDIDHFKVFNDTYGHDAGDQLLRMLGARLAEVGGGGRPFRYGGEEFAVIFSDTPLDDALPHLETLRQSIESTGFGLRGPASLRRRDGASRGARPIHRVSVSVSIGAAEAGRRDAPAHEVLDAADAALYRAKRTGRNRVCT